MQGEAPLLRWPPAVGYHWQVWSRLQLQPLWPVSCELIVDSKHCKVHRYSFHVSVFIEPVREAGWVVAMHAVRYHYHYRTITISPSLSHTA